MAGGELPGEGPVRLGPVTLPTGRLIPAGDEGEAVGWATADPVPESGRVWAELSELHPQTGLVPVLLRSLRRQPRRPWDSGELGDPVDLREVGAVDPAGFAAGWWEGSLPDEEEYRNDEEERQMRQPFGLTFPGLAPAAVAPLTGAERERELGSRPPARIGLVRAGRPADALAALGWSGTGNWDGLGGYDQYMVPFTAMLRSWEDRFGARLLEAGFAEIRLLVERPPRTRELAEHLAAEQSQLADDCTGGERGIPFIASRLLDSPYWTFWWD